MGSLVFLRQLHGHLSNQSMLRGALGEHPESVQLSSILPVVLMVEGWHNPNRGDGGPGPVGVGCQG